jgi:APA family basic amino acid/polyamine antiporter
VLSLISLVPLLNAILMIGTRILFALGRDGLLWSGTAAVNARGTPGLATLITTVVAVGLIITGTFERLVGLVAFYLSLNYAICSLALVALRRREPAAPRPFRAWGYPWTAGLVVVGALAFLISALIGKTSQSLAALALLVPGLVVHAVLRTRR